MRPASFNLTFNRRYFFIALIVLAIEIFIARFMHDRIVRPFIGDVLVVVLLYALLKTVCALPARTAAWSVFVFACVIEVLQYFHLPALLGLESNRLAVIVLGATFDPMDILAYALGALVSWRVMR